MYAGATSSPVVASVGVVTVMLPSAVVPSSVMYVIGIVVVPLELSTASEPDRVPRRPN